MMVEEEEEDFFSTFDGFEYEEGSYGVPVDCGNGVVAASLIDCDTATRCLSHQMVLGHICVDRPEIKTTEYEQRTTESTVTIDNATGEIIDQVDTSSSTTGGDTGRSSSAVNIEAVLEFEGPCDPSQKDYYDCIEVTLTNLPEHTSASVSTFGEANTRFYDSLSSSAVAQSFSAVSGIVSLDNAICPLLSVDLSSTLINQTISTTIHCELMETVSTPISAVMFVVYVWFGFRIFASA